jgi:hypothetical protein
MSSTGSGNGLHQNSLLPPARKMFRHASTAAKQADFPNGLSRAVPRAADNAGHASQPNVVSDRRITDNNRALLHSPLRQPRIRTGRRTRHVCSVFARTPGYNPVPRDTALEWLSGDRAMGTAQIECSGIKRHCPARHSPDRTRQSLYSRGLLIRSSEYPSAPEGLQFGGTQSAPHLSGSG